MIRIVIEEDSIGKRPLGRLRLRLEDCVERDVRMVGLNSQWRESVEDGEEENMVFVNRVTFFHNLAII